MRTWLPWLFRDPDQEVLPEREILVARSRDAYRNQPIARSAINTKVTSVVGAGLELHCRIDRKFLAFGTDAEASDWEGNTERLFRAWADSTDADARRRNTFYKLQSIAFKAAKMSGEIFALMPLIPRKNTICALRVHLIEADRVSTPMGYANGPVKSDDGTVVGSLWDGVETGVWGEPVAYHVETTIPTMGMAIRRRWQRVLAYGNASGRRQVIHFYEEDRPGQRRGLPMLAPILETLKQIARYSEAELAAAVLSGMFTVFVKHSDPMGDPMGGARTETNTREGGEDITLGPGAIIDLQEGEDITIANPGRPNQQFGPFVTEVIKQIGMGLDIPYEVLTKQFNSSYSASRAAILQAWEVFNVNRDDFISAFCQPIYVEWLSQMVATGRIVAPGFFDDVEIQRAYCKACWYGPTPMQLDPLKEANAAKTRIENFLSTIAEEAQAQGRDYEEIIAQRAREMGLIDSYGLSRPPSGTPQTPDPQQEPDQ